MKKWPYIITWVVSLDRNNLEAFEEIDSVHLKYGLIKGKRFILEDAILVTSKTTFWIRQDTKM